ncbi:MAG TPA: DUF2891 domain-containing protein [Candidatus Angelobacter sp.]|jgi:hypothetical protein|nr:DUF2891 domain-containing protein [Candidatus Angelobacter sp.]
MKTFDIGLAERLAALALECVHREYPNKINHLLNSDADAATPRKLTPAFYGCYDWHSAVHTHWLLARLARLFPEAPFASRARKALHQSLTRANIAGETAYLKGEGRAGFERPYGLAWLLRLSLELHDWSKDDSWARGLAANLQPLESEAKHRLSTWLPQLPYPVRSGEHSQTAFALGLMIDYARGQSDENFLELLQCRAIHFYGKDEACPLAYEPSGEDFLSPSLAEADLMTRVLSIEDFSNWLTRFLPQLPLDGQGDWLRPVKSPDPSDPKFSHLDGLNLSRAWMLERIASALSPSDQRGPALTVCAHAHAEAGLPAVSGQHYVGSHWLGTFAVYLLTS